MKSHPKIIDRILEIIGQSQSICVAGHVRPDGDCIGSQLGLTLALRKQGKEVVCWNEDAMPQKYAFLDPDHLLQKPAGGTGIRPGHLHRLRLLRAPGRRRPGRGPTQMPHQHRPSPEQHALRRFELDFGARGLHGRIDFPPVAGRPLADHAGHCRLPFHRRFDRHRLLPISHHQAGDLSHRRRIGEIGGEPGDHLPRGLSILFPLARPPAQARLQSFPSDRTTTRSPISGSRKGISPAPARTAATPRG